LTFSFPQRYLRIFTWNLCRRR